MQAITVTIGRNVGDKPMSPDSWNTFISKIRETVEAVTNGELWFSGPGRNKWDGVPEESFIFYGPVWDELDGVLHQGGDMRPLAIEALRGTLAILATYYGQEAIGLTVGEAELIESLASYPGSSPAEVEHTQAYWHP